ncbi:MAG: DUF1684 domain-containing protein [Anaerolineales bacterium]|jgi:uncharacterized protein (DUF1684 family)
MTRLESFRAEKDEFFAKHLQSPLTHAQKHEFKGLKYYPENPGLRLEIPVEVFPTQENVSIQTTGDEPQLYKRYGRLKFEVEGQGAELTVYSNQDGFFLPFVDSLAGKETYPAGRYIEVEQLKNGKFLVDFNLAYNPYCAYNDAWSCPLTPAENRLKVAIRAGEKIFHAEEQGT